DHPRPTVDALPGLGPSVRAGMEDPFRRHPAQEAARVLHHVHAVEPAAGAFLPRRGGWNPYLCERARVPGAIPPGCEGYRLAPTASIPGGSWCGNYARIYDVTAVRERLLANIDRDLFRVTIAQVTLDGEEVPDLALTCHRHVTAINRPYRALLIERRA